MSEAEIIYAFTIRAELLWSLVQWWASITFGLLIAAHLGAGSIKLPLIILGILLYTIFSFGMYGSFNQNIGILASALTQLSSYSESAPIGEISQYLLANSASEENKVNLFRTCIIVTYFFTTLYVLYSYLSSQKANQ